MNLIQKNVFHQVGTGRVTGGRFLFLGAVDYCVMESPRARGAFFLCRDYASR